MRRSATARAAGRDSNRSGFSQACSCHSARPTSSADSRRPAARCHCSAAPLGGGPGIPAWGRAAPGSFGLQLANEHLDAVAAIAGHGVTIGSPILFRREIEAGRLVPAPDLVVGDGRAFWLTYPAVRRVTEKIGRLERWLMDEAAQELIAS